VSSWAGALLALALLAPGAIAMEARPNADDPALEQRLLALTADLRCVVCQNESLAESRAPLARDLRQEVRELMRQGRSDAEVVAYLTDRYGDFVLYRPPLKPATYLLWFGPALFLGIGAAVWLLAIRGRQRVAAADEPSRD
jgi:cytochrome c-type biogenesis protein CcmH